MKLKALLLTMLLLLSLTLAATPVHAAPQLTDEYHMEDEDNWPGNVLLLNTQHNTFTLTVNLLEGYGTIIGTYVPLDNYIVFEVEDRDFGGFIGEDVDYFSMLLLPNGNLEYSGLQIGMIVDGTLFLPNSAPASAPMSAPKQQLAAQYDMIDDNYWSGNTIKFSGNTFTFTVNLLEGYGTITGTYTINGNDVICRVEDQDFMGFTGDHITTYYFRILGNGNLQYANNENISMVDNTRVFAPVQPAVPTASPITVLVNGQPLYFDQPPVIKDGRTLVPMRAIFEAMGATVSWNDDSKVITAVKDYTTVVMQVNSTTMYRNGLAIQMDVAPEIINGRTMAPARAAAEGFGASVDWNQATQTISINY